MAEMGVWLLVGQAAAPAAGLLALTIRLLLGGAAPRESMAYGLTMPGLALSMVLSCLSVILHVAGHPMAVSGDADLGVWLRLGDYEIPAVLTASPTTLGYSALGATLTLVVALFSRSYMHREPGFVRFYAVLGLFAVGTQLVALAGALEIFFAGWELLGLASVLFIGFFHEREEPVRSAVHAFATFRLADAGLLLATVATYALFGSTRFAVLGESAALPALVATGLGLGFLLSAMGKSAQLPFSDWLPRAMEGPTPSSALFYGAISIHAGVILLIRVEPLLAEAPAARAAGVAVGLATAAYAALVARTHPDAKGALAHATLTQVGLMVAEVSAGWPRLALAHLIGHALLRLAGFLRAPNLIHDAHRVGHHPVPPDLLARTAPRLARRLYAQAVHRLRLDDRLVRLMTPIMVAGRHLDRLDGWYRARVTLDRQEHR